MDRTSVFVVDRVKFAIILFTSNALFLGTCDASRFYSNLNRTFRFEFDSKVTCRFENFESAAHAMCRHTTNYAHSLFNKNITFAPFVVEVYVWCTAI